MQERKEYLIKLNHLLPMTKKTHRVILRLEVVSYQTSMFVKIRLKVGYIVISFLKVEVYSTILRTEREDDMRKL